MLLQVALDAGLQLSVGVAMVVLVGLVGLAKLATRCCCRRGASEAPVTSSAAVPFLGGTGPNGRGRAGDDMYARLSDGLGSSSVIGGTSGGSGPARMASLNLSMGRDDDHQRRFSDDEGG